MLVTIHLHKVLFFAHHGMYRREKEKGNHFEMDLDVRYKKDGNRFKKIEDTINYADIYSLVQTEMVKPTPLLEEVCQGIILKIREKYKAVKEIRITLYKLDPPIPDFKGRAGVTLVKKF